MRRAAFEAALMLWFKTFYETLSLPKLNGVAINGDFCEPPRFVLIRAADINPIENMALRPDHIGAVFFHRTLLTRLIRKSAPERLASVV